MSEPELRCTQCGGKRLTPPLEYSTRGHLPYLRCSAGDGLLSEKVEQFTVTHAVVCLECGHVDSYLLDWQCERLEHLLKKQKKKQKAK